MKLNKRYRSCDLAKCSFLSSTFLIPALKGSFLVIYELQLVSFILSVPKIKTAVVQDFSIWCKCDMNEKDLLLNFPFHSFSCFELLKEGSCDAKCQLHVIFFRSLQHFTLKQRGVVIFFVFLIVLSFLFGVFSNQVSVFFLKC